MKTAAIEFTTNKANRYYMKDNDLYMRVISSVGPEPNYFSNYLLINLKTGARWTDECDFEHLAEIIAADKFTRIHKPFSVSYSEPEEETFYVTTNVTLIIDREEEKVRLTEESKANLDAPEGENLSYFSFQEIEDLAKVCHTLIYGTYFGNYKVISPSKIARITLGCVTLDAVRVLCLDKVIKNDHPLTSTLNTSN